MAAKPPKPPGSFLKSLLNQHNNNKNQPLIQQQQNQDNADINEGEGNSYKQHVISTTTTNTGDNSESTTAVAATKKSNCNCSNISIMHLFHEMKQEFPTIPDTIVTQCVNENCHQRENCIQMLKNELELNPIPAQSYPAKVLHPSNSNNLQNSTNSNTAVAATTITTTATTTPSIHKPPLQQKPPLKPIKPIRAAPLQPPNQQQSCANNNYKKINATLTKNTPITTTKPLSGEDIANVENIAGGGAEELLEITSQYKQAISTAKESDCDVNSPSVAVCHDDKPAVAVVDGSTGEHSPRQRPTTLNLNTQLQKHQQQQRQRLNIQLQQRFQEQRNRQQPPPRQQQHQQQSPNPTTLARPTRKAPLPPVAPKPSQFQLNHTNTNAVNNYSNDTLSANHTTSSPISESEISLSVSLSTPSPTSSSSPQQPFNKPTPTQTSTANQQQHFQTKSPIRHRSVITLQPEPPYTRDFLFAPASLTYASSTPSSPSLLASPTPTTRQARQNTAANSSSSATSSPTASVPGSQKSFTSVNLTLRPPISPNDPSSALQPSTIDITAGPGFSGASGGGKSLHYSSTSYDARLGYQQNFQITVTDECGIFTASRIRPQLGQPQRSLNQQQQQQHHLHHQFHNNNVLAVQQNIQNSIQSPQSGSGGGSTLEYTSGSMCSPPQQTMDAPTQETLQRQKKKRDKLAAALREYKKRLGNVEQEINLLTGTIATDGLSERLDEEITKLRRDCQDMLRSSNTFTQQPSHQELAINHQLQQQQQPQPFPRQRIIRPPPRPPPPRQTSLDIIQHHSQTTASYTPPAASLPNLNVYNSLQPQQQQNQTNFSLTSPPYYHQQSESANSNFSNNTNFYTDHHSNYLEDRDLVDDDGDNYDEYGGEIEPWECNMCTFRNHPQLNICETCENVRILPGRLTNFSRALSTTTNTNATAAVADSVSPALDLPRDSASSTAINSSTNRNVLNTANANLEHDTNLVQQQLQHFALHT